MIFVINNLKYDTDKDILLTYDLKAYEKMFGELKEA